MAINTQTLQVLAQVMALSDADKAALTQALVALGTVGAAKVSAPIAQAEPVSQAPVSQVRTQAEVNDTVVEVVLSHDGKGVEFYLDLERERDAFAVMGGVREILKSEGLKLEWDKSLVGIRTYHDDRNGHVYGAHKPGAYALVGADGKHLSKAKVAEWVKAHPMVVLTAEEKAAYKAAKADKQAKKLERERKVLAKYGYTMPNA